MPDALPPRPDLLGAEDLPAAPRQRRSRETRTALLEAALALFAQHGFERSSIGEIAGQAGVGAGTFYQHFRSKRQVLLVLMDALLGELEALELGLGETGDPAGVLERALQGGLLADRTYAGAYRAWREAVLSDRELGALDQEVSAWTAARVEGAFRSALTLPGARPGVDVEETARLFNLMFWQIAEAPERHDERTVQAVVKLVLHALFTDEAFSS